jgi:hypothetical protein
VHRALIGLACAAAAVFLAASATAEVDRSQGRGTVFGVAEDASKYAADGGARTYADLRELGMEENRWSVFWNPDEPATIQEKSFIDRSLPVAQANGIRIVFSVYPSKSRGLYDTPNGPELFCAYVEQVARTYPYVTEFIVGNEPNQPRFFQPQFVDGKPVAGAFWADVLGRCYDRLKAVNPAIKVVGLGLSPRGNDNANAPNNVSRSPVRFMRDLGEAYRKSGRDRPLFDLLAMHLYPNDPSKDTPSTEVQWPNVSLATLDRMQQAVWDAFNGTAQPVFADDAVSLKADVPPSLQWKLDEIGWQVEIEGLAKAFYTGNENVEATTEARQAEHYGQIVRRVLCQSLIAELFFFHLIDETDLDRFQSGLQRADGTRRPAFDAVKTALSSRECQERVAAWRHRTDVDGGNIRLDARLSGGHFAYRGFNFFVIRGSSREDAVHDAMLIQVNGQSYNPTSAAERARLGQLLTGQRSLAARTAASPVQVRARDSKPLKAYFDVPLNLRLKDQPPGWYVVAGRLRADMNPARETFYATKPFALGLDQAKPRPKPKPKPKKKK